MKLSLLARVLSPLWAFTFCIMLTCVATLLAYQTAKLENAARFDRSVNSFVSTLRNRMTVYTNAVIATRNLFLVKKDVSAQEFEIFVDQLGIRENFPGIQSLGFIERLSIPDSKKRLRELNKSFEHSRIPPGSSAASLIRYAVSFESIAAPLIGLDMGSTEERRIAMDRARDSGRLVASDRVVPLVMPNDGRAGSFLMFIPVYKGIRELSSIQERRDSLRGFIYGGFRSENLFGRLTKDLNFRNGNFFVQVYDGEKPTTENMMFSEGGEGEELSKLETTVPFTYADHTWSIRIVAPSGFLVSYLLWAPWAIFGLGLIASLVLAFVLRQNQVVSEEASAANQAKSMFLANISHEIRTPLGVILGFAEMALGQNSQAERESSLKTIIRNGKELTRIIGDVLDVSKIEANLLKIERNPFCLQKMLDDIEEVWRPQVEAKGLQLEIVTAAKMRTEILADETRIKQILINLISNATKFTSQGFIRFSVSTEGQTLKFSVADSGIGVSEENQKKLFKPFSQGDSSITRKFGGSGLGLALSREIAKSMGGTLVIEQSRVGLGSEFVFTVPYEEIKDGLPNSVLQDSPLPSLAGKKILLVEDSPDNRALVTMMLHRVQAQVDTAQDGVEGVKKALQTKYDLVLMDIQMPNKDGYTAFLELKALNFTVPVIALTAHALMEEREKAIQMGFADYLTKPVDYRALIQMASRFV